MSIVLGPEVEQQIQELVQNGRYSSAEECVRHCINRAYEEDQWIRELAARPDVQAQIEAGVRDLAEGRFTLYDCAGLDELAEEIKREGRARLKHSADAR